MPELPDVEGFKRYLDATSLHKRIEGVKVNTSKILSGTSGRKLTKALAGRSLEHSKRRGKHLFVALDDGRWLTWHFGMTGRLAYFKSLEDDPEHDRLRLDFENGYHLAFDDRRLFGRVGLVEDLDAFIASKKLGPDAMDDALDRKTFVKLLRGKRGGIKAALMDQSLIAGIGNVYADEILFQAHLHPESEVQSLDTGALQTLYGTMRRVLRVAIDRGAGSEELADKLPRGYLLPKREEGEKCPRCRGTVEKIQVAGRSTYYCPRCQKKP